VAGTLQESDPERPSIGSPRHTLTLSIRLINLGQLALHDSRAPGLDVRWYRRVRIKSKARWSRRFRRRNVALCDGTMPEGRQMTPVVRDRENLCVEGSPIE
jgi:hypothetical protein